LIIADDPCHGLKYHPPDVPDYFPNDNIDKELQELARLNVKIIGITFTDRVKEMYKQISFDYFLSQGEFQEVFLDIANIEKSELKEDLKNKFYTQLLGLFVSKISN